MTSMRTSPQAVIRPWVGLIFARLASESDSPTPIPKDPCIVSPPMLDAAAFVLAGLLFFLPALWGTSPIGTARTALSIHRAGFTAPRSYPLWLLFNPIDFLLFLGPPVALAAIFRIDRSQATPAERRFRSAFAIGVIALLISGVVRGEVGRIAIPLMPAALLALLPRPRVQGAVLVGALLILLDGVLRLSWQLP